MGVYGMWIAVSSLNTFGPATTYANAAPPSPQADELPRKEF